MDIIIGLVAIILVIYGAIIVPIISRIKGEKNCTNCKHMYYKPGYGTMVCRKYNARVKPGYYCDYFDLKK